MTNSTNSFSASSVQASAYQHGRGTESLATSAATSGNTNTTTETFGVAMKPSYTEFSGVANRATKTSTKSITNLTVSSLEETVTFYTNVFGWSVEQMTESYALLTNGISNVCAMTEEYANEAYGFATKSPFSSGTFPTVTTTLVCKDVNGVWDAAIASGATPVQAPATNINNVTSATLIGPDNYVWVITNNSNMLI